MLLRAGGSRQFTVAFSHGFTFEVDAVSVVYQAVENGIAEGGIADDVVSMIDGYLGGDDRGPVTMAVIEQFEQIATLLGAEFGQPPIVEDDQVGLGQAGHELCIASVTMGQAELFEQPG